jgi:hypothetical protein
LGALPSVTITAPPDGARFPARTDIQITADLDDIDHGIDSARLYKGVALVGEVTTPPFTWTIAQADEGNYALKLVAQDSNGQTYTAVQQLFVGEAVPRVEITSPRHPLTFCSGAAVDVAFDIFNWTVAPEGDHLHVFVDGTDQARHVFNTDGVTVNLAGQGKQSIRLALTEADETVRAVNDSVIVYVMEDGLIADYEDGIDLRGSLSSDDASMVVSDIGFAWGTSHTVASRADGEDDINYYDIYNNDDGWLGTATCRLDLRPAQDWTDYTHIEIKTDGIPFNLWIVDAGQGSTSVGRRRGAVTTLELPDAWTAIDEVIAIELRYDEASAEPGSSARQHLRRIQLLAHLGH